MLLPEPLDADAIGAALSGQAIGNCILVLEEVTSTNDLVFQHAAKNAPGLVVFAERQSAGRGQHGKQWESSWRKGLWFSVLLRAGISPKEAPGLTTLAAKTIASAVNEHFSLGAEVKPPNDVYVGPHKIAGVLLERRALPAQPHAGILGIGINVSQSAEDFPEELRHSASSLASLMGKPIDRQPFAISLLRELNRAFVL